MEFLIAGLLVLDLAVTLVSVHLLRREEKVVFRGVGRLLGEAKASLTGVNASQAELMQKLTRMDERRKADTRALQEEISAKADTWLAGEAETVKSLSGLWTESQRQTAALQSLLSRGDASEAVRELARQLEDSPSLLGQEEESALSKAMEEGISNILGFSAGRTAEGRT